MCCGCYKESGSPTIDNERVRDAARAIKEVYEHSCVGGNLHVYLDDWNIGWESPEVAARVMDASIDENVHEGDSAQLEAERRCAGLFAGLSEDEQASALGLHDGCWGIDVDWSLEVDRAVPGSIATVIRTLPGGIVITGD